MQTRWRQRFFTSTRGKVVARLRLHKHTVDELAQHLSLTDNAIRSHLAALERDGLVRQEGLRRGAGKPSFDYELTEDAEDLFPKAYRQVLNQLLTVLDADLGTTGTVALLRRAGEELSPTPLAPGTSREERLAQAVRLLDELGGVATIEDSPDRSVIAGNSCPLSDVTARHPEACELAASLLGRYTGLEVCARCDLHDRPHCRFEVEAPLAS